jgi:hypothetical protein
LIFATTTGFFLVVSAWAEIGRATMTAVLKASLVNKFIGNSLMAEH